LKPALIVRNILQRQATSRQSPASGGSRPWRSTAPCRSGEVRVAAGDLVVADDTGVCFIPRDVVLEVLDAAEEKAKAEAVRCKAIDDGVPVPDIARATYGEK
jgi:regulator of RNase E activity RraA